MHTRVCMHMFSNMRTHPEPRFGHKSFFFFFFFNLVIFHMFFDSVLG